MTYLMHVKEEFLSNMEKTVRQGLKDTTEEPDFTKDDTPDSTYGANLKILHTLVLEDRRKDKTDEHILERILNYLRPPYQDYVRGQINNFQSAGGTPTDVLDNLLKAYSRAIEEMYKPEGYSVSNISQTL